MSKVALVKDLYGAFKRADIKTILDALDPEVSWGMVGRAQDVPMAGIGTGRQAAADFFRILAETVDITSFEPREFRAAEDRVYVHGDWRYVARNNGQSGANEWLHVFTFRGDTVVAWHGHNDTAQIASVLAMPRAAS